MAELDDPKRLAEFRASILKLDGDRILQDCVESAAKRAEAPMALVSFVMKKVQLFRAAVGLPPELEATRATSRKESFCQFVVKTEEPFIVTDAKNDTRVPRQMIDTYGLASYAGVPIRVGGQVLGSLCVADGVPREWTPELVGALGVIADRVSERLETLTALGEPEETTSVPPSNLAARAAALAEVVQRSLVEVGPMVRLARGMTDGVSLDALVRAGTVLTEASEFYDELVDAVGELCVTTKRVQQSVVRRTEST
jgi:GAF domain-containing protein